MPFSTKPREICDPKPQYVSMAAKIKEVQWEVLNEYEKKCLWLYNGVKQLYFNKDVKLKKKIKPMAVNFKQTPENSLPKEEKLTFPRLDQ